MAGNGLRKKTHTVGPRSEAWNIDACFPALQLQFDFLAGDGIDNALGWQ